jgi:hypothetical protein
MIGYHFTDGKLRDGRPLPPIGEWLIHDGPIIVCKRGLHASEEPLDALNYAPGPFLDRVELDGELQPHGDPVDKWAGRLRRRIGGIDATELLWNFARWCALQVIDEWYAPEIMREYLETADPALRQAAGEAARAAWRPEPAGAGARAAWDACGYLRPAGSAAECVRDALIACEDAASRLKLWQAMRAKFAEMVNGAMGDSNGAA